MHVSVSELHTEPDNTGPLLVMAGVCRSVCRSSDLDLESWSADGWIRPGWEDHCVPRDLSSGSKAQYKSREDQRAAPPWRRGVKHQARRRCLCLFIY